MHQEGFTSFLHDQLLQNGGDGLRAGLVSLVGFSGGSTEIPESQSSRVTVTDWPFVSSNWSGTWIKGLIVSHEASRGSLRNHHFEKNGFVCYHLLSCNV